VLYASAGLPAPLWAEAAGHQRHSHPQGRRSRSQWPHTWRWV